MRLIAPLPILMASALLAAGCDRQKADAPQGGAPEGWQQQAAKQLQPTGKLDRSKAGTMAPDTPFEDENGDPMTLADFRGKPVLVNLWATWCAPCVAEMPTLDTLAGRGDDIHVLAISQDMDGRAKVGAFFGERDFKALIPYIDPNLGMMMQLGVSTLPTTILYDSQGKEVWRMTGIDDWASEESAKLIAEADA